jgi:hypothetical protein
MAAKLGREVRRAGVASSTFASCYLSTLLRPRRTFDALMKDPRRLSFGALALTICAVLYTFVYIFLSIGGGAPLGFKPFLAIPTDVYYRFNVWILFPSMFGCWILAAGVAHLLSKPFGGRGTFDDTLSTLGFSISIACLASLLHDLPSSVLGAVGLLDLRWYDVALNSATIWRTVLWIFYGLYLVLFLVLFPKAVGASQRIRGGPAILIGVLSFIVYQGVFIIFNR